MPFLNNTRTVRIEWGHCDAAGIVFYPRYFEMFDHSTAMLFEKALGMSKQDYLRAYGFGGFPVVTTRAQFFRPTTYGDDVAITSSISFGRSSFSVTHVLTHKGELAVQGEETRVWVIRDPDDPLKLRSHPIPAAVIEKFTVT